MTQKELGYVELEWTCKRCGTINPGMQRVCTNCGAPMGQGDKFDLPDEQKLITEQEKLEEAKAGPAIQCPYCNVYNPAGAKICKQCGGDIRAGLARQAGQVLGAYDTNTAPEKPCPFCNQPVKAGAQRCPNCGGSLVEAVQPAAMPSTTKKTPRWLTVGGIALGLILVGAIIAFVVMNSRRKEITASVTDVHWQTSIEILALQPVQHSAWSDELPSEAQNVSCRDEFKETSDDPAPNATEECGTPYTIDTGSGAGKVVQDCVYQIYASYCKYTVEELAVIDTAVATGTDTNPYWPVVNLQSGEQEGNRLEQYSVNFSGEGQTYSYWAADASEFHRYAPGSEWALSVNGFGNVDVLGQK
jgi:DNA-directed RNA polymerase subunit RPC12/RpoP